jgi:AP-1 complex subunit gamma-1
MGYSPEHDVSGITDPFNQVKIMTLLRKLGKNDSEASEHMNDVLAQVATNTETSKNAGNAILYECVQTIMGIESDSSLRVLAINILGRFLLNRDNNIRYVALNSLSKVVSEDIAAVQRQRNTIIDCLKDPDISIRQRALELIYQLVNEQNVIVLSSELLNYLVIASTEQKSELISKLMSIVEKYSPNQKWRIDTVITMLSIAGNHCDESVMRVAVILIAQHAELQAYAVHRLYKNLLEDSSQLGLVQISIWCIGEYGEQLTRFLASMDGETASFNEVNPMDIVQLLERCMRLHNSDVNMKCLILNALMKLSVRLPANIKTYISEVVSVFNSSMSLELQQRSMEFGLLLTPRWDGIRSELVAKMPILSEDFLRNKDADSKFADSNKDKPAKQNGGGGSTSSNLLSSPALSASKSSGSASLLDLDDIFGGNSNQQTPSVLPNQGLQNTFPMNIPVQTAAQNTMNASIPSQNKNSSVDLLSDIFSMGPSLGNALPSNPTMPFSTQPMQIMNPTPLMQTPIVTNSNPTVVAFDKNGFVITMELSKPAVGNLSNTKIFCRFSNKMSTPVTDLNLQVNRYLQIQIT